MKVQQLAIALGLFSVFNLTSAVIASGGSNDFNCPGGTVDFFCQGSTESVSLPCVTVRPKTSGSGNGGFQSNGRPCANVTAPAGCSPMSGLSIGCAGGNGVQQIPGE